MNLREYQELAKRTNADLSKIGRSNLIHMDMGIITELGELLDPIKKYYAYQKELDRVNIGEEIGDMMWYLANKANEHNINLDFEFVDAYNFKERNFTIENVIRHILRLCYKSIASSIFILMSLCVYFDLDFEKILSNNIAKLQARYPEKFTTENALNRDLEKERKILEQ